MKSTSTLFSLLTIILLSLAPIFSQECGLSDKDQTTWIPKYMEHLSQKDFSSVVGEEYLIPIVFHLVARDNGVGRAKVSTALNMLCELNTIFSETGITFYVTENSINFIDDDGIFTDSHFTVNQLSMNNEKQDSAINVFIVNSVGTNNVVGFYDSNQDWVLLQKSVFLSGNKTLAHEIGHFFSLLHPHFGWDAIAWDEAIHGNPCPEIASDGITPTEKMNGSNCSESGDLLCDTAPDYNFGITWSQSCDYKGEARDPNNIIVDPNETLIMSYYSDSCRQVFSNEQKDIMQLDIEHSTRDYLHRNYIPTATLIDTVAELTSPIGLTTSTSNSIYFIWQEVEGAQYYYIEYDRSPYFNLAPQGMITTQTNISIIHPWIEDISYYWKVIAWNELHVCSGPSESQEFIVDYTSFVTDQERNKIKIYNTTDYLNVDYQLNQPQNSVLNIYNIAGQIIYNQEINLPAGKGHIRIHLPEIFQGVYVVSLSGKINVSQLVFFI